MAAMKMKISVTELEEMKELIELNVAFLCCKELGDIGMAAYRDRLSSLLSKMGINPTDYVFNDLTKLGIPIVDESGNFRSFADILCDLSKVAHDVGDNSDT